MLDFLKKFLYVPKTSTIMWVLIAYYFFASYILNKIDNTSFINTLNNVTEWCIVLLIHALLARYNKFTIDRWDEENIKISILHFLNPFLIIWYILEKNLIVLLALIIEGVNQLNKSIDE